MRTHSIQRNKEERGKIGEMVLDQTAEERKGGGEQHLCWWILTHKEGWFSPGTIRDKTMQEKFMYIPNDNKQNSIKVFSQRIRELDYKTLGV